MHFHCSPLCGIIRQSHKYPVRWITGNEVVAHVPQSSGEPLPTHVPTSLLCLLADKLFLSLCPWVPNGNLQQRKTYIAIGTMFGNKNHCPNTTRPSSKPMCLNATAGWMVTCFSHTTSCSPSEPTVASPSYTKDSSNQYRKASVLGLLRNAKVQRANL